MKNGLKNIAQGTPEQLLRVKRFLVDSREAYPEKQLKTHAEVIDFAIEQAEKVPSLEKEIEKLKKQIAELVGIVESEYGIKGDE